VVTTRRPIVSSDSASVWVCGSRERIKSWCSWRLIHAAYFQAHGVCAMGDLQATTLGRFLLISPRRVREDLLIALIQTRSFAYFAQIRVRPGRRWICSACLTFMATTPSEPSGGGSRWCSMALAHHLGSSILRLLGQSRPRVTTATELHPIVRLAFGDG